MSEPERREMTEEELEAAMDQLDQDGPPVDDDEPEEDEGTEPPVAAAGDEGDSDDEALGEGGDHADEDFDLSFPDGYTQSPQDVVLAQQQEAIKRMEAAQRKFFSRMGNKIALLERAMSGQSTDLGLGDRRQPQDMDAGLVGLDPLGEPEVDQDQRDGLIQRLRAMERTQVANEEERMLLSANPRLANSPRWEFMMQYVNRNQNRISSEGDADLFRKELRSLLYEAAQRYQRQGTPAQKAKETALTRRKRLATPAGAAHSKQGAKRSTPKNPEDYTLEELEQIMDQQDQAMRRRVPRMR